MNILLYYGWKQYKVLYFNVSVKCYRLWDWNFGTRKMVTLYIVPIILSANIKVLLFRAKSFVFGDNVSHFHVAIPHWLWSFNSVVFQICFKLISGKGTYVYSSTLTWKAINYNNRTFNPLLIIGYSLLITFGLRVEL